MIKISLLDFFRTGQLGPVQIGMSQASIFTELGEPDRWIDGNGDLNIRPFHFSDALVWGYDAFELYWHEPGTGLHSIIFSVDALHWPPKRIKVDPWIFRKNRAISWQWQATYLRDALDKTEIPYKDTGLEIISHGKNGYEVVPFTKLTAGKYDPDDVFGTIVLKSGVQIRYGEDDYIIKVAMPGAWMIKGGEQFIKW